MWRERLFTPMAVVMLIALLAGCGAGGGGAATGVKPESASAKRADAARVNTELGQTYLQQGRLELALDKLNRAIAADAGYADAHTVIAVLYDRIGDASQAEVHYRRAAQLKPKSGAEQNNYGMYLCKTGRYTESQPYFERAMADPFYATPDAALTNAGTCLVKAGRYDEAEKFLRLALERAPNNADSLFQLAAVLYQKGDFFRARAFMQRFDSLTSPRPESLLLGRNIELRLGNATGARDYTDKLLKAFPESTEARALAAPSSS